MGGKTNPKTYLIMAVLLVGMGLFANTNVCKGDDAYIVLDDMEDYNDRDDIREVWRDGNADVVWGGTWPFSFLVQGGSSGSNLNVSTAVGSPLGGTGPIYGNQAMVLRYDNDGWTYTGLPGEEKWVYDAPYYSEIEANVGNNSLNVGQNWAAVESLSLSFQGHPISDGYYDASGWPAYTVNGRGRDIGGRHDEFYFFSHYPFIGSGSIQAEVRSVENTDPWAKAGVMIREKWTPYSKFAAVFMTPGQGVSFQYRDVEDGPATHITKPGVSAPQYVRLVRTISGVFQASHSDNGSVWLDVNAPGSEPVFPAISMGTMSDPNLYIGSAVSSHNANQICAADFNELVINPLPSNWIFGNIGTNDPEQLYVALSDGTNTAVVNHPNPNAATLTTWQEWNIELTAFTGVNFNNIQKVYIGLGDRDTPVYGGSGTVYIDVYQRGPTFLFVDAGAPAGGNGTSWADAFINLQDALAVSIYGDDILVAQGTYKPDQGAGLTLGDRTATFQLINDVAIYGGYAGWGEPDPNARDIDLYKTILSGDLNGDDVGFTNNAENSYHVVTGSGTDATAILDGFTITASNADGSWPNYAGGGMYNSYGNATVANCTFSGNSADYGGGMYNDNGSPTLRNCTFSENSAGNNGGGMYNYVSSNPIVISCTFTGNSSNYSAGGMYNNGSSPTVTNCTFSGNLSVYGGGMYNIANSSPTVTNCTFNGNSANGDYSAGGGMRNSSSSPTVTNCTFSGNSANYGGGMYNGSGSPTVTNCTFSGNSANYGGGMFISSNSSPTLTNCILWGNSDSGGYDESAQISNSSSTTTINYSCVQGWTGTLGGVGNIGDDPSFVDPNGLDDIVGTEDDNLELAAGSPCIDAGYNPAVPPTVVTDLDGKPRFFDDAATPDTGSGTPPIVDMGACEFYRSLVAHWKLDEIGGNIAYDSSGNGHHGTLYGDPNWQPIGGIFAGALEFDGLDDYVLDEDGVASLNGLAGLTVALWIKSDVIGTDKGFIHFENPAGHDDRGMRYDAAGATGGEPNVIKIGVTSDSPDGPPGTPGRQQLESSSNVQTTDWQHLAMTWNSGEQLKLYINGVLDTPKANEPALSGFLTGYTKVIIGRGGKYAQPGTDAMGWDGLIDDVRIYNYALSADEVRWLLCTRPPRGDVNRDCRFDFVDFAILASEWLDCGFMVQELCGQ